MMKHGNKLLYLAVFCALVIPLMVAGIADAKYLSDGAVQNATTGAWELPTDLGVCVTGIITLDNTLAIGTETSRPDCIAHTFPAYTTNAACGDPANSDGAAHFWGKTCVDGLGNGISLKGSNRDNTACVAAGGTWTNACAASWMFTGAGFCYAAVDVTATYGTQALCEAVGGNSWKTKGTSAGSCVFSYGIGGGLNGYADRTSGDWGAVKNLAGGTTLGAHLGSIPDLTVAPYNTQGGCVEAGFGWNPYVVKTGTGAMGSATVATVSGSGNTGCVRCHNTVSQYNGTASRWVGDTFMKTGHKNMLRKVTVGTPLLGPDDVVMGYDASNNPINWTTGQINVSGTNYDLAWLYGDWIDAADPVYGHRGRAVYKNPAAAGSYSCGRCHATGWSSDLTVETAKEPEISFPNITWTSITDNASKIKLAGGIFGYSGTTGALGALSNEKMSSWDQWGIQCSRCHRSSDLSTPGMVDNQIKKWTPTLGDVKLNTHDASMSGPNVVSLCMECHRQETSGLPYTWTGTNNGASWDNGMGSDPSTVIVGDAHGVPGVVSHPAGNQFLNSPHGKFTGTWDNVNTLASYGSWFMKEDKPGCMGCHNIHQSLAVDSHPEPFSNECTSCHTGTYAKPLDQMKHPMSAGTPAGIAGADAAVACEICHMPKGLHLWRINTNAAYSLFPATAYQAGATVKANTYADGAYTQASWVDLDLACGQCHGGGTDLKPGPTTNGAMWFSKTFLSSLAAGIHTGGTPPPGGNQAPVAAFAAGYPKVLTTVGGRDVLVKSASIDNVLFPASAVTVNWGDGVVTSGDNGVELPHTYLNDGTFNILMTVQDAGGLFSSVAAQVTVPATYSIHGSVGVAGAKVYLKYNGVAKDLQVSAGDNSYTFANVKPGNYKVQVYKYGMVFDGDGTAGSPYTNPVDVPVITDNVLQNFTLIARTITVTIASPSVSGVTTYLKQNGVVKDKCTTNSCSFTVAPGIYQVQPYKLGTTFDGDGNALNGNQSIITVDATGAGNPLPVPFTHTP